MSTDLSLNNQNQDHDKQEHASLSMQTKSSIRRKPWILKNASVAITLLITSVIAMWATITIIVERSILENDSNHITSCDINPWMSCGQVMKSWQAMTFGFPNTYIGIIGFSVLITIAMSMIAGAHFKKWYWIAMNIGQAAAFAFCVWLWYSAVYSIGTLCLYCMIVWLMVTIQFAVITARNMYSYGNKSIRSIAGTVVLPFILLIVCIVSASILIEFGTGVLGF